MHTTHRHILTALIIFTIFSTAVWAQWPAVYDTTAQEWADMAALKEAFQSAQIVYVGELHNHTWGHRVELTLLETLFSVNSNVAISMEMFERDIQAIMDGYLAGEVTEEFFLRNTRPWKNYTPDYRPIIEFARAYRLPVLAANVPRRYAAYVAAGKDNILEQLPDYEKNFMAEKILAPEDEYYKKFSKIMVGHVPPKLIKQYYRAQCLKDDTMAKSIVDFLKNNPEAKVISYTGAFHSDEHLGVVYKVARQLPEAKNLVVSIIPVEDGNLKTPEKYKHLGNFVLFAPGNDKPDAKATDVRSAFKSTP